MAAIMTGCLSHREARVLLAVVAGAWSAGSAARATGLDRAHCTRAIRSLACAGWLRREAAGRVLPVDNPPQVIEAVTLSVENDTHRRISGRLTPVESTLGRKGVFRLWETESSSA